MVTKDSITGFSLNNSIKEIVKIFSNKILPIISDASHYTITGISGLGSNGAVFLATDQKGNTFALKVVNILYYFIKRFDLDPIGSHKSAYTVFNEISERIENAGYHVTFEKDAIPSAFSSIAEKNSFYREISALKAMKPDNGLKDTKYIYLVENGILHLVTIENETEQIYEFPYIVMPYVNGTELTKLVEREMQPSERLLFSLDWIGSILDIVDTMHSKGVVHRDLHPNNILFGEDGKLVLVDFGSAITDGNKTFETLGERRGARRFMPPEQFADPSASDCISDYFFIGGALFSMLTLITPYDRNRDKKTFPRKLGDYWPKPNFLSDESYNRILSFVDKSMSFSKEDRYQSIKSAKDEYNLVKELVDKDYSTQQKIYEEYRNTIDCERQ